MKVLVVGSGGREHALAWAIARSPRLQKLYVASGNGGTRAIADNVDVSPEDIDGLLAFAESRDIDLTVVGPEAPLVAGIVDRFEAAGRRCFGPSAAAARLEGSKVFAKEFMERHGIPTASFRVFDDAAKARAHIADVGAPVVIKADGLAAGKGVIVAQSNEEACHAIDAIMVEKRFGASGDRLIVEECLTGQEVSVHSICGGGRGMLFPSSQDHKRIFDGDRGPNTGGMGAYAPVPFVSADEQREIHESIVLATLRGMEAEGCPFAGVLYAGLMMTDAGPRVLEYNVRFGDPETQVLLPLIKSDLLEVLFESAGHRLPERIEIHEDRAVATVVVAAGGYPGAYEKGAVITGLDDVTSGDRVVFHAGTAYRNETLVTSGGRVLAVTAWSDELAGAIARAYDGVAMVRFDGAYYRRDIGSKAQ